MSKFGKSYLIDLYLDQIKKVLKDKSNFQYMVNIFEKEKKRDKNREALASEHPNIKIYISEHESIDPIYDMFDIDPKLFKYRMMQSEVNVRTGSKGSAAMETPYYILFPLIILAMEKLHYSRKDITKVLIFYGLINYRTAQQQIMSVFGKGKIPLNDAILKQTSNNMIKKFILKKVKSIGNNIQYTVEYYYYGNTTLKSMKGIKLSDIDGFDSSGSKEFGKGREYLLKGVDINLLTFRQNIRSRIKSPLKKIRDAYSKLEQQGKYMNTIKDIAGNDGSIKRVENQGSTTADIMSKALFIYDEIMMIDNPSTVLNMANNYMNNSSNNLRSSLSNLKSSSSATMDALRDSSNGESDRFLTFLKALFTAYYNITGNISTDTLEFIHTCDTRIFGISNNISNHIIYVKNTLDDWMKKYYNRFNDVSGGTQNTFKKHFFIYLLLLIYNISKV